MRKLYPPKERLLFDGGLNNKYERSLIQDNESPDCLNVLFSDGAVSTRPGYAKLNTGAVGSFACDGLYTRHNRDGSETMVAFFGGDMQYLSGTTLVTIPSAISVFTAGQRVAGVEYENYLFIGNGSVTPYKYNGDFTRHGIYPPTATAVASNGSNGTLTGSFVYAITNVNTNLVESDYSPLTSFATLASQEGYLYSIPVAPQSWGVESRRIYRAPASNPTSLFRVGTLSDNTSTTFTDNTDPTDVGVAAPTDQGVPPNYSVALYAKDRLFVNDPNNPNYVWYSELGNPYVFKATNFLLVGDNTSDLVKGLAFYNDTLYIKCDRTIEARFMPSTTPSDWVRVKIKSAYGTKSPFGIVNYQDKLFFPAMQNDKFVGFGSISGDSTEKNADLLTVYAAGSDLESNPIETDMFLIKESLVDEISSIVFKNRIWTAVPYTGNATENNRIYIFDFSMSNLNRKQDASWVPYSSAIQARCFTIYDGELYFGSALSDGFVYQAESSVYNDEGSAIDSYYWTKEYAGNRGDYLYDKDFRYANILVENAGAWFMDLVYRVDSDKGGGTTKQIDLDPGSNLWGSLRWGLDMWGGGSDQEEYRVYLDGARGKRIQFKFTNQNVADQRFRVYGLNFTYNMKGLR